MTAPACEKADRERDERILAARQAGETQKQIANREGIKQSAISKIESKYSNRHSADRNAEPFEQEPEPAPLADPTPAPSPNPDRIRTIISSVNAPEGLDESSASLSPEAAMLEITPPRRPSPVPGGKRR